MEITTYGPKGPLYDNNQQAENENVRTQNLWDSLEQLAAIMIMD